MLTAGFRQVIPTAEEFSLSVCPNQTLLRQRIQAEAPDIVLADMNGEITLDILRQLRAASPGTGLILWIENVSTEFISQAISLGVLGVLRKDSDAVICLQCLRHVALGKLWIDNDLSMKLLSTRKIKLTPRERQLMGLLAQGLKNKEMAYRLGITEGTVKVYLSHLYEKVGASDRFELALLALKNMATDQSTASKSLSNSDVLNGTTLAMPGFVSFERQPASVH
jgi:DNA-binding NarL/FixJ family response regulator